MDDLIVGIEGCLEPMKEQFHTELVQKLTPIDSILKENIGRMLRSKVSFMQDANWMCFAM